jgi:hypothetical protein
MTILKNVAAITYTTSKYADAWSAHFGQLSKHLGGLRSYAFSDKGSAEKFDFKEHVLIEHDDTLPYHKQYLNGLDQVNEDYVVYLQEDFFLYDDVNHDLLAKHVEFLQNTDYDYVRLIRCGFETPLDRHVENNLFEVHMDTNDAFSMQATMWKKDRMRQLYDHVKSDKWLEGPHWNKGCLEIGIKGVFAWNGEPKIGKYHHDSKTWPYISTAINKGQWNLFEYPLQMEKIIEEYNIDVSKRGVRKAQ